MAKCSTAGKCGRAFLALSQLYSPSKQRRLQRNGKILAALLHSPRFAGLPLALEFGFEQTAGSPDLVVLKRSHWRVHRQGKYTATASVESENCHGATFRETAPILVLIALIGFPSLLGQCQANVLKTNVRRPAVVAFKQSQCSTKKNRGLNKDTLFRLVDQLSSSRSLSTSSLCNAVSPLAIVADRNAPSSRSKKGEQQTEVVQLANFNTC